MSYSFGVKAANKADAKAKIVIEFDKVVAQQGVHTKDRDQAQAAANAFVDLLDDDDTKDINVSMSGSLSGSWSGSNLTSFTGANVSVSAYLVDKVAVVA